MARVWRTLLFLGLSEGVFFMSDYFDIRGEIPLDKLKQTLTCQRCHKAEERTPKNRMKRLLIANRGEIAVRIIRACREAGVSPIAVYSEADRNAPHVALADAAVCIGPSPAAESYL